MTACFLLLLFLPALLPGQVAKFRVRESAGLRRFSFPTRASFRGEKTSLRLLDEGKPVPAQFTALGNGVIEVDFNVSCGPWEVRNFRVDEGAGPVTGSGVTIGETDRSFLVKHSNALEFEVPKNLLGLLRNVKTGKADYLRPGSHGLLLNYKDDVEFRAGGTGHWGEPAKARIFKQGPLVCGVRFETLEGLRGDRSVKSVVEMEFPRSKSWVEVRWMVDDPQRLVTGQIVDLNLNVEGPPSLVDFGAGSMVYAALKKGQRATLTAGAVKTGMPLWAIDLDGEPYAGGMKLPVEGWAHVMDKQRAIAIAVDEFADGRKDSIAVSSEGHLAIRRDFPGGGDRNLKFWLHFVSMPVQIGAATSPQSMQSPLKIEWQ